MSNSNASNGRSGSSLMINLKIFGVVLGTLGTFTYVANAIPQIESDVPEELSFSADVSAEELVAAGEQLYNGAGGCLACHGLGTRAPNLLSDEAGTGLIGARCANRVPGEDCKTYLYNSMVAPSAYLVEGYLPIMPDMSRTMSSAQVWSTVAYLEAQGGTVTVTGADIEAGGGATPAAGGGGTPAATAGPASASLEPRQILQDNLCLACHVLDGEGPPLGPAFDGMGGRLTADELRTAILDPAAAAAEGFEALLGTMPANFGETLTAAQLEAVVGFLSNLR